MHFTGIKIFTLDYAVVETTKNVKLAWRLPNHHIEKQSSENTRMKQNKGLTTHR